MSMDKLTEMQLLRLLCMHPFALWAFSRASMYGEGPKLDTVGWVLSQVPHLFSVICAC